MFGYVRGTVDVGQICDVPDQSAAGPDAARPHGLHETVQMEVLSIAEQRWESRELPHTTRHYMTAASAAEQAQEKVPGRTV